MFDLSRNARGCQQESMACSPQTSLFVAVNRTSVHRAPSYQGHRLCVASGDLDV